MGLNFKEFIIYFYNLVGPLYFYGLLLVIIITLFGGIIWLKENYKLYSDFIFIKDKYDKHPHIIYWILTICWIIVPLEIIILNIDLIYWGRVGVLWSIWVLVSVIHFILFNKYKKKRKEEEGDGWK